MLQFPNTSCTPPFANLYVTHGIGPMLSVQPNLFPRQVYNRVYMYKLLRICMNVFEVHLFIFGLVKLASNSVHHHVPSTEISRWFSGCRFPREAVTRDPFMVHSHEPLRVRANLPHNPMVNARGWPTTFGTWERMVRLHQSHRCRVTTNSAYTEVLL